MRALKRPITDWHVREMLTVSIAQLNCYILRTDYVEEAQKTFGKMHRLSSAAAPSELVEEPRANGARAVAGWNT